MKILHLIHSLNQKGGGIASGLRELPPQETTLVSLDSPTEDFLKHIPQTCVPLGPSYSKYGYTPRLKKWLDEHLHNFDAAVIHGLWQYHGLGFLRSPKSRDIPFYVFPHGMMDAWFQKAYLLKRIKKNLYWFLIEKQLVNQSKGLFFTSSAEISRAHLFTQGFKGPMRVVAYGIKTPLVDYKKVQKEFLEEHPDFQNKRIMLFFGRIHPKKGVHFVIEAWVHYWKNNKKISPQDWILLIVGPHAKDNEHYYHSLIRKSLLSQSKVIFIDYLEGLKRWGALSTADFFILPSHQENFGIAVIEALAAGTPVLLSKEVNTWKQIIEDKAGYADEDSFEGTLRLIKKAVESPLNQQDNLNEKARLCFRKNYDLNFQKNTLHSILAADLNIPYKTFTQNL